MQAGLVFADWREHAACRGPEAFVFYPPARGERLREKIQREKLAKTICSTCPVRDRCLEHAFKSREIYGIWGGATAGERKDLTVPNL